MKIIGKLWGEMLWPQRPWNLPEPLDMVEERVLRELPAEQGARLRQAIGDPGVAAQPEAERPAQGPGADEVRPAAERPAADRPAERLAEPAPDRRLDAFERGPERPPVPAPERQPDAFERGPGGQPVLTTDRKAIDELEQLMAALDRTKKKPRLRFAPSPTGHLHVGGARTALMNYLAAQKLGGEFHLRIEDTDQVRSKPHFTDALLSGLRWLGLRWEEPVLFQSQRAEIYQGKVRQLIRAGRARTDPSGAVLFKMSEEGLPVMDRAKHKPLVASGAAAKKDFVIQRSDGTATFLLASVVDDGESGITHIIRGDEHMENAARQIQLYRALRYPVPEFYHVPLIHSDKHKKLSKRDGAPSILEYQELGCEPIVLVNHLARLGMRYESDETVSLDDLSQGFDLQRGLSSRPSLLGIEKLEERGRRYLESLPKDALMAQVAERLGGDTVKVSSKDARPGAGDQPAVVEEPNLLRALSPAQLEALVEGARKRAGTLSEIVWMGQFVRATPVYNAEDEEKILAPLERKALVGRLAAELATMAPEAWTLEGLDRALSAFESRERLPRNGEYGPVIWMLLGVKDFFPLPSVMTLLGREETLRRLEAKMTPAAAVE